MYVCIFSPQLATMVAPSGQQSGIFNRWSQDRNQWHDSDTKTCGTESTEKQNYMWPFMRGRALWLAICQPFVICSWSMRSHSKWIRSSIQKKCPVIGKAVAIRTKKILVIRLGLSFWMARIIYSERTLYSHPNCCARSKQVQNKHSSFQIQTAATYVHSKKLYLK